MPHAVPPSANVVNYGEGVIEEDNATCEDASKAWWWRGGEDGVLEVEGEAGGVEEVKCKLLANGKG